MNASDKIDDAAQNTTDIAPVQLINNLTDRRRGDDSEAGWSASVETIEDHAERFPATVFETETVRVTVAVTETGGDEPGLGVLAEGKDVTAFGWADAGDVAERIDTHLAGHVTVVEDNLDLFA